MCSHTSGVSDVRHSTQEPAERVSPDGTGGRPGLVQAETDQN